MERLMWTPDHRRAANRNGLRYPSDLTDEEWIIVAPMIPPARHGGRKRSVNVREVLNGIFYVLWTGCQWKALPKDLPPKSTVHDYLELWNWDGTLERIHHALYVAVREQAGREASPTVAIIDSQTAKGAQKGGLGSILQATTRARRSRVASGTSWSTRWACCLTLSFILPMFRTVTALSCCCAGQDDCSRLSNASLPMVAMPETRWRSLSGEQEHGNCRL